MNYPNKTNMKSKQKLLNFAEGRLINMLNRDIVYVKGCGFYWLYKRANGVRGMRFNNRNYDVVPYLKDTNKDFMVELKNTLGFPELHNFLMSTKIV